MGEVINQIVANTEVNHDRFGSGVVEAVRGDLARIRFSDGEVRDILVGYPGLVVSGAAEGETTSSAPEVAPLPDYSERLTNVGQGHVPATEIAILARLRVAVGWAGELADPPWWGTQYHSDTARSWMDRVFPRTNFQARVTATSMAAASVHDRAIGSATRHHLFRLPPEIERQVGDAIAAQSTESALSAPARETMEAILADISGSIPPPDHQGPVRVGPLRDALSRRATATMAAAYLAALRSNQRAFPYFADDV